MQFRRFGRPPFGARSGHALLLVGSVVMTVGSLMPWLRGSTRTVGNIHWTGLDDSGEGAMLIMAAVGLALFVRVRGAFDDLGPRSRFIPLVITIVCGLLWIVAFRKLLQLSWFELEVGARPQLGIFVALAGILVALGGSLIVALGRERASDRDWGDPRTRGSGAGGGVGTAFTQARQEGGIRPDRDGYSVVTRVGPLRLPGDDDAGGGPDRG